jgi:plasmid stability protein
MSSLLIRNVDDALRAQLKARARMHRRSLEEEVRETLRTAIASDAGRQGSESLLQIATRLFGPARGLDADPPPRGIDVARTPPDFSGSEYDR